MENYIINDTRLFNFGVTYIGLNGLYQPVLELVFIDVLSNSTFNYISLN